jgi:hypothetical protein
MNEESRKPMARAHRCLKKYRVTILPTFGPVEVKAESEEDAKDLANHYWDEGWNGEFVTEVKEVKEPHARRDKG